MDLQFEHWKHNASLANLNEGPLIFFKKRE